MIVKTVFAVLITVSMVAVFATGALAYTEEDEKEAAAGADATNPTAD